MVATFLCDALVSQVSLANLLVQGPALFDLALSLGPLLLILPVVQVLVLLSNVDVLFDGLVVLQTLHLVVQEFSLNCVQVLDVLLAFLFGLLVAKFLLEHHLALELASHLVALVLESVLLLTFLVLPVGDVAVDLCGPLGICHTNYLTLQTHADKRIRVKNHPPGGNYRACAAYHRWSFRNM